MVIQLKKNIIPRDLANLILPAMPPKAVVIYGPRRAGKTTLVKSLLGPEAGKLRLLNADRAADVRILQGLESGGDIDVFLNSADTIVIDEAQRVPNIGLITKILVDANQRTKLFLTGSSSFDLARGVRESAVGRLVNRQLWPFSASELAREFGWGYVQDHLEQFLVYGMFPDTLFRYISEESEIHLRPHAPERHRFECILSESPPHFEVQSFLPDVPSYH